MPDPTSFSTPQLYAELLRREQRTMWRRDPLAFGKTVFPHHFSLPPAAMHREMVRLAFTDNANAPA